MAYHYHQDHAAAALGMDPAAAGAGNPSFAPGGGGGMGGGGGGWEREKAAIEAHPLYERLLEAHVACLRVATPVDQLPRIDAQIAARAPPSMPHPAGAPAGGEELDLFMILLPVAVTRAPVAVERVRRWVQSSFLSLVLVWASLRRRTGLRRCIF